MSHISDANNVLSTINKHILVPTHSKDESFYQHAVKILVRKIIRTHGNIKNLINAIKNKDPDTACVKMEKTLDGRMQGKAHFSL